MTRERVTQPLEEQRKPGVIPVSPRLKSNLQGLPVSLRPAAPEVIAARESPPERAQAQPRVMPQTALNPVPLEPRLVPPPVRVAAPDLESDALEGVGDERAVEARAEVKNDPTVEAPSERRAALEAHRAQPAAERTQQQMQLARAERVERSARQTISFGRGEVSSAGLGSVLTALQADERLEVLAGVQRAHPAVWAKLEALPVIRWDEDWRAFNAGNTARGVEQTATLETSATTTTATITTSSGSSGSVASLHRAYEILSLPVIQPAQAQECQRLIKGLVEADALLEALDGIEAAYPGLKRDAVLNKLLAAPFLAGVRTQLSLQALGGMEQVTFDGFVEQLTSFMAYSNNTDFSDAKNARDPKASATGILNAFGYSATPSIHGAWGLQMMVFTPIPGKAKYKQTVLAFRGTEAVKVPTLPNANAGASSANPSAYRKDNESELDTATDFTTANIAYTQFDSNHGLIADTVKKATRGGNTVVSGHSLGGALAQITAARFPVFQQILTFQAPHVKAEDVDRLEAQQKLRSRNYRMNFDVVPLGGPQARMAGEVVTFGDGNNPLGQHHTPMLSELLENAQGEGVKLNAQQLALVAGKQPPNELGSAGPTANRVEMLQVVPGREDSARVSSAANGLFGVLNENVVANNLLVNVLREVLLPELGKITVASIKKSGGVQYLLQSLGDTRGKINSGEKIEQARARPFSSASKEIFEAYTRVQLMPDATGKAVFDMTPEEIRVQQLTLQQNGGMQTAPYKLLEVALWWKTGSESQTIKEIIVATTQIALQDLGRWWYSVNLDGEDLYRALVQRSKELGLNPPYL